MSEVRESSSFKSLRNLLENSKMREDIFGRERRFVFSAVVCVIAV
jgi:hypothetical protein